MEIAEHIAQLLLDLEAVKVKTSPPFRWTSGLLSPVYCDNRLVTGHVDARNQIIDGFKKVIEEKGLKIDVIAGTATAAISWAAFLAHDLGLPMVYIRPEPKAHGAGRQIEGYLKPGSRVLIVEDLISTGGSSIKSAKVVQKEGGCMVTDILAITTWELESSKEAFAKSGLKLHTLTDFTHLIGQAVEKGYIKADEHQKVLEFKEDPPAWGKKMGYV
jgi:orotate phosphoribosyltransferase